MLSFIWRFCPWQCLQLNQPPPLNHSDLPTARPASQLSDTDPARLPHFYNAPLSPSIIHCGLTIDEVNYSISLTSRSHQGQLYQPDNSSQPELYGVENAVPLAASLGTEQASAVWSAGQFGMQRSMENKPDEIYIWSSSNMYCSALLCLIRLAPSWYLPGLAAQDFTAQIVGSRCTRNAKVLSALLAVNSWDKTKLANLYL